MTSESVQDEESGVVPDVVALAKVVARLRADNERLEHLAATTAVVERAKGMLMARSGCSAADAHEELTRRAHAQGRTLVEECWTVLGEAAGQAPGVPAPRTAGASAGPRPGAPAGETGRAADRAQGGGAAPRTGNGPQADGTGGDGTAARTGDGRTSGRSGDGGTAAGGGLGEALAGVGSPQELAGALLDHLAGAPVHAAAVVIFSPTADGALELAGHAGAGAAVAGQWRHVPPVSGIAAQDVIRTGEAIWLEDLEKDSRRYHLIGDPPQQWPTRAWLPVLSGDTVTAVLGVMRALDAPIGPPARDMLHAAARLCAGSLRACGAASPRPVHPDAERVQRVFDALPGPAVLLTPLRSPAGDVEDFRIDAAAPHSVDIAGRRGRRMVGLRVLECYPTMAGAPPWRGYLETLATGQPYEGAPFVYEEVVDGIRQVSSYSVRAARLGDGLVVTWIAHDSTDRQQQLLADLQRLGNLGWTDWNLATGAITWSPQVHAILDRDPERGPVSLEELPGQLLAEDVPAFATVIQSLLDKGTPVDHPFRITTSKGVRHLRIVAEAVPDASGTPVEVRGFVQDVTAQRRAELALLETQQAVLAQRNVLQAERTVAARLQHALLPLPGRSLDLGGLHVDVTYLPSHDDLNVGGDWYSALEMPDGSVLFAVGDVAGHGIDAVATMAQLRFTAKGMVITGSSLTGALHRLNTLLLHTHDGHHTTATMVLGRYDPVGRCLTWAQAGHPPPLLVRQGKAEFLAPPEGMLLGATARPSYGEAECRLEPGDHLLLYTDGLIERPGEHLDEGFGRFAEAARRELGGEGGSKGCGGRPIEALLARLLPGEQRDDVCLLDVHLPSPPAS
ncbi:SpoIIE family protein phosphatase [Streptomyces sp. NPDC049555]|uniref:SpoIIE family protein phosphatase n=1 Tax=Streptomyces sp. NPDC049555 TaxID=3154930 RepID=UPI00342F3FEC